MDNKQQESDAQARKVSLQTMETMKNVVLGMGCPIELYDEERMYFIAKFQGYNFTLCMETGNLRIWDFSVGYIEMGDPYIGLLMQTASECTINTFGPAVVFYPSLENCTVNLALKYDIFHIGSEEEMREMLRQVFTSCFELKEKLLLTFNSVRKEQEAQQTRLKASDN